MEFLNGSEVKKKDLKMIKTTLQDASFLIVAVSKESHQMVIYFYLLIDLFFTSFRICVFEANEGSPTAEGHFDAALKM